MLLLKQKNLTSLFLKNQTLDNILFILCLSRNHLRFIFLNFMSIRSVVSKQLTVCSRLGYWLLLFHNGIYYTEIIRLVKNNSPLIAPKNKSATRNANRIIREGVILKGSPALPTPITALNASTIKTKYCLTRTQPTSYQMHLSELLLV